MPPTKKPADELHSLAAPRELVDWVRMMPPESAARSAWVDATRADWMPFLAKLRGLTDDAILRATCECVLETYGTLEGAEAARLLAVLHQTVETGRSALATVETDLADLKLAIIASSHETKPTARPAWMPAAELVFELSRAAGRGRILAGIALAMKMLAHANPKNKPKARPAHQDLVARFRDKLVLAG
ncbi:MAG: hypothetical protein M4D80_10845 [Myxococcota bacterium]|nr:hypothetical protein [Deltaproteobacteria bacterium]MDQ3335654.1 hypothetical protein [Myxococcota bacterium]